ncbi:MAG: hypothetical protein RL477_1769 [Pseudomonadota bacterium]|jgi:tripartite-type tricarboxylate transporter receptor subunit TctC
MKKASVVCAAAAAGLAFAATPASADAIADFYKGKTVTVFIGYAAGGGYDEYARFLARHWGNHIPGNPTVIPRNMTGAGSIVAANAIYNSLPQDGTAIGAIGRGIAMEPLFGRSGPKFDATKFTWIGSMNNEVSTCVTWHTAKAPTIEAAQQREVILGATAQGSDGVDFPIILNNVLGTKYRLITGYPGGSTQMLAMERGEIDGRCGWSWSSIKATRPTWVSEKKISITIQIALKSDPELSKMGVPLVMDLAKTDRDKAILKLIFARQTMGRPFIAGPKVPADRAAALRASFDATMKDARFRAETDKAKMEIDPVSGQEVADLVKELYATPKDLVQAAAAATARKASTRIEEKKFEDLKGSGKLTKIEDGGRKLTFDIGGKPVDVGVTTSGTTLTVAGKAAKRTALKPGMSCAIVYPGGGSPAKSIACD